MVTSLEEVVFFFLGFEHEVEREGGIRKERRLEERFKRVEREREGERERYEEEKIGSEIQT